MNNWLRTRLGASLGAALAGACLLASLGLPLWKMKMEAPQYQGPDTLSVTVYPGAMKGDLNEITLLNQYIGVTVPKVLPELRWLPLILVAGGLFGLWAALLGRAGRGRSLAAVALAVTLGLGAAAGMAQWHMYEIGHERNEKAALRGVRNFTPPLLGTIKVANFEIRTRLGAGAGLIAVGLALQYALAWMNRSGGRAGRPVPTWEAKANNDEVYV